MLFFQPYNELINMLYLPALLVAVAFLSTTTAVNFVACNGFNSAPGGCSGACTLFTTTGATTGRSTPGTQCIRIQESDSVQLLICNGPLKFDPALGESIPTGACTDMRSAIEGTVIGHDLNYHAPGTNSLQVLAVGM